MFLAYIQAISSSSNFLICNIFVFISEKMWSPVYTFEHGFIRWGTDLINVKLV